MEAMSISEARQRLFELRELVVDNQEAVIMTHKKGNAVLISMAEWEAYQETMRLLNDKTTLQALVDSFAAHDAGIPAKSVSEVFADLV